MTVASRFPALRSIRTPSATSACSVMGVVNVTPDSFSDGGRFLAADAAIEQGLRLWSDGADLIDVGGESTRPGAYRVTGDEELRRIVPVVAELSQAGAAVSIDTTRAAVAEAAVAAGAVMINDVSGGLADPGMAATVASLKVPWVLNHSRGPSRDMYRAARYRSVLREVTDELMMRVDDAIEAGADASLLIVDPGLGFAKEGQQNWELLKHLDDLVKLRLPILVGASRKRFLADVVDNGPSRPAVDRDAATVATTVLAAQAGAWGVRVHDVRSSVEAIRVVERLNALD
ncbi:dihydropteroate synthase [Gordonia terrae]